MDKVRVGIIGTGYTIGIARRHVEGYTENPKADLVALYDIIPGRAQEWADKKGLKDVTCYDDIEEFYKAVDAVSITTPNSEHVPLVIDALRHGKHVLCEKPFSTSGKIAMQAVEEAKKHPELVSMICFNYREIPAVKYMKSIVDSGRLGKVFTVRQKLGGCRMSNSETVKLEWRMQKKYSGTGGLADFSSHMLDLADWILTPTQGPIVEVAAMSGTFVNERYEIGKDTKAPVTNDDATVYCARTENGALYSFTSSRVSRPGHYFEISAEGGILVYDSNVGDDKLEVQLKEKSGSYEKGSKQILDVPAEMKGEEAHRGIINAFVAAIVDGKKDVRTFDRGIYIQNILDKLEESAETHSFVRI